MSKPKLSQVAAELIRQFPKAGSLTLARMLLRDHKALFKDIEAARRAVRYARGATGQRDRAYRSKELVPLTRKAVPGDPFAKLPKGLRHYEDQGPFVLEGVKRVAVLSDLHIPYHDKDAIRTTIKYLKGYKPDCIILNGDIADIFSLSFWEKDPRKRGFSEELETVRLFLQLLRQTFPKARIIFKKGNHEERFERYMSVKAPELLGVSEFALEKLLHLEELKIELVGDRQPIQLGKLSIVHGHEFRWGITSPVNPARGFYLRAKSHVLGGHLHQPSHHSEKTINDVIISAWSTGCLCDLKPDYARHNSWSHGFATVTVNADGFEVNNKKIINGRIYSA